MTEIISAEFYMNYQNCSMPGCLNGGKDYRTLSKYQKLDNLFLYSQGWVGANISDACKITSIVFQSCKARARSTSDGYTAGIFETKAALRLVNGSASGESINESASFESWSGAVTIKYNSGDWKTLANGSWTWDEGDESFPSGLRANSTYPSIGLCIENTFLGTFRAYFTEIKVKVTRTRACYVTFKGDGITTKTTMYDYESIPVYGATGEEQPVRAGYTFKGWNNGTTTYPHGLPVTGEVDITYTAVWEKNKYTLTVNAGTGGTVSGGGTYEHGTSATITATPNSGYKFVKWSDGNTSAARTITVTGNATYTAIFEEAIVPPEIVSAAITYGGAQVSAQNKVPAGEGFLLAVGLK